MISYVVSSVADELREAHRMLLVPSFRSGELVPEDEFVAQFEDRAEAVLARDEDGRLVGAAVLERFSDAVLLQYLVAAPQARGTGVGSGLLTAAVSGWASSAAVMLAEFDRPDVQSTHPLHGDPTARLRFYARFGALALDLPYFQPPVSASSAREHGMLLAVFDQDGRIAERGRLAPAQSVAVQQYLQAILDGSDDPDAGRLRDAAAATDGIRVFALERYFEIARSPL